MHKKIGAGLIFAILVCILAISPVRAFSLNGLADDFKNLISPKKEATQNLTLDSKIELAEDGDIDKNGTIDAGDIVTFTYVVKNPTDQNIAFATLKTNIPRDKINFIHNVRGTASIDDNPKNPLNIPNLRVNAKMLSEIKFDARLNYATAEAVISTEPEILSNDKKSLIKSVKQENKVGKFTKEIPSMIEVIH